MKEEIRAHLDKEITIELDGREIAFKGGRGERLYPIMHNGNVYVPLFSLGEQLQMPILWSRDQYKLRMMSRSTTSSLPPISMPEPAENASLSREEIRVRDFIISDLTVTKGEFDQLSIAADITNVGAKEYDTVFFKISFYNFDQKRIGTADGDVYDLRSGETKTVEFLTLDPVENYASLKVQVDSAMEKEDDLFNF